MKSKLWGTTLVLAIAFVIAGTAGVVSASSCDNYNFSNNHYWQNDFNWADFNNWTHEYNWSNLDFNYSNFNWSEFYNFNWTKYIKWSDYFNYNCSCNPVPPVNPPVVNDTNNSFSIVNSSLVPVNPTCSESLEFCSYIKGDFEAVKMICEAGSTTATHYFTTSRPGEYCKTFSNVTLGAVDSLSVNCTVYAKNSTTILSESKVSTYDCSVTPTNPICGNGIVESGESCDLGNSNGVVCNPLYGSSCNYCTTNCSLETVYGSYCGDNVCDSNEDYLSCSADCSNPNNQTNETHSSSFYSYSSRSQLVEDCTPVWQCSGWSECLDGVKNRNCVDLNHCAIGYNKPSETVGCEIVSDVKVPVKHSFWPFVTAGLGLLLIGLLVFSFRK